MNDDHVFRTPPRSAVLAGGFLLGAGFFGVASATSTSMGARVPLGIVALIFLVVAVRCAAMRIVADASGLKLYGSLFSQRIPWASIEAVVAGETEVDAQAFGVRTPIIILTTGRKVKAQPVSSHSFFGGSETAADHIAGQLEDLRRSNSGPPRPANGRQNQPTRLPRSG
ncbi:hypothetical protein AB0J80_03645 [Actinoplanes sp. NPDC049548]|uniref:hypothetical protein n=1 Tax=Actinoplanes sp. NPDC049548 TaxID=3155152 RepID=UPI003424146B